MSKSTRISNLARIESIKPYLLEVYGIDFSMEELEQSVNDPKHYFIKKREKFSISFKIFDNRILFKGNVIGFNKDTQQLENKTTSAIVEEIVADANKRIQVMHAVRFKSFMQTRSIVEFFEKITVKTSIEISNKKNTHDKTSIEITNNTGHLHKIIGYENEKLSEYNPSIYLSYKKNNYDFSCLDAIASKLLDKWNISRQNKNKVCWKSLGALTEMHFIS